MIPPKHIVLNIEVWKRGAGLPRHDRVVGEGCSAVRGDSTIRLVWIVKVKRERGEILQILTVLEEDS